VQDARTARLDEECWVPWDRVAEDGVIADRYPVKALPNGNYRQRTRQNVVDSDGTALLYYESLEGGTRLTRNLCALEKKPFILIDARKTAQGDAAEAIVKLIEENGIHVLNVAGPRATGWALGHAYAMAVIGKVIEKNRA